MSDLFHRDVSDEYIDGVFDVMERVDRHVYQVLTKRPERMMRYTRKSRATRTRGAPTCCAGQLRLCGFSQWSR